MSMNRRDFLSRGTSAGLLAAGFHAFPVRAADVVSPHERLNIAAIGATARAGANIAAVSSHNIVAIADVDADLLGKGCEKYPHARQYRDFRVMLEKEAEKIDAVLIDMPKQVGNTSEREDHVRCVHLAWSRIGSPAVSFSIT